MAAAVLDDGVEDGAAFAGGCFAYKQEVLFPDCCRSDRIFDQVMPPPDLCRVVKLEAHISGVPKLIEFQRAA